MKLLRSKGGLVGLIVGGLIAGIIFSIYPATDNLYFSYPMYLICGGGLECAFTPTSFVASVCIHLVLYFLIGYFIYEKKRLKTRKGTS